ncbi:mannose-1-phosphate guanylyltransferase/phosphomannomutase [Geothermobacter ehrlichii]|uniref:Mannose-1-phosphate guanylyltransferase/phosphomannomutase n=1 Tax=Geothermobacter ehrlichii TaxID=213224 RepID=A0A5D3WNY1_9BACT|nr:mannose-1-phosphate guanyltransferase [Geothermobacter ehrlichii]TYO99069.1 mannose-1-phosphate guanylyltransferase/phosphomannomutase [Geothermobacter ehrlichii]
MKAVIMAGGFGTRIQPLTINLPKPMIPLANRPIMLHIVDLLKRHGITELVMLLYHQPEIIKNFFRDGSEFGVRIRYVTPLEDFGTAGAVKAAAKFLDETFLIISGDLLTDIDLRRAIDFHRQKKAQATIALTSVSDPLQFGVVITDAQGRITKFLEKPGWGEVFSDTINTGIYVIEPGVLDLIPEQSNRDWSKDVFPAMLADDAPLFGCRLEGYWADIGNTDAYLEACRDIARGRVEVTIEEPLLAPDRRIYFGGESSVENGAGAVLEGLVIIGENTQINGRAVIRDSIIGRNCTLEDGVELNGAVLWDNVYVKSGTRISDAVLGHNARTGRKVTIEPGVIVGDETTIGDGALLKRNVKIWPRKVVEADATVTTNLIWGERWRKSLFEGPLVSGLTNVELTPEFTARLGAAYGSTLPRGSTILAGRDAIRSSRMLKRSFVGGLLSAGINVRDVLTCPLPVLTFKLATFGEVGGVHFRQSPTDPAATEIVFLDAEGLEFSSAMGKSVERIYFKENFRRAHHSEPGGIFDMPGAYDVYRDHFLKAIDRKLLSRRRPKVVIDLNHSPAADLLPGLLNELGCEVVEINSHVEESKAGTTPEQKALFLEQLSRIVVILDATAGIWLGPSGEKLTIIDDRGEVLSDLESLVALCALSCGDNDGGRLVVPVSAPSVIDELAARTGLSVERTRVDGRALVEAATKNGTVMAGTLDGRFAFPALHPNFDGLFTVAKMLEMLCRTGSSLHDLKQVAEHRHYLHREVPCSAEYKGGIMRRMSETASQLEASFIDGVRITHGEAWVLVLPDQFRPVVHLIAEAEDATTAGKLLEHYREKITAWKKTLEQERDLRP